MSTKFFLIMAQFLIKQINIRRSARPRFSWRPLLVVTALITLATASFLALMASEGSDSPPPFGFCQLKAGITEFPESLISQMQGVNYELSASKVEDENGVPSWNEGGSGATHQYYDKATRLSWDRPSGDWIDAQGVYWGKQPFASKLIGPEDENRKIVIDVTDIILRLESGGYSNNGFYILTEGPVIAITSKENENSDDHATLTIKSSTQSSIFGIGMDTHLKSSTVKSSGHKIYLKTSRKTPALLWFDLSTLPKPSETIKAELSLHIAKYYGSKQSRINLFLVNPAPSSIKDSGIKKGISSKYPYDCGISGDPEVFYTATFEHKSWKKPWLPKGTFGQEIEADYDKDGFKPLLGKALDASLVKNSYKGINQRLKFNDLIGKEPEEAYFRYYARLGSNWNNTISGGKLPGFAGTYNKAGWGGRRATGNDGWSARGKFLQIAKNNVNENLNDILPIGSYVYHVDQKSRYGSNWLWNQNGNPGLKKNRWYSIEQHVKLNTPGKNDGVLRAWLDGRLVFERHDIRFRDTKNLKIEEIWLNIYHGGTEVSPFRQSFFIDNLVVSTKYIGPMHTTN